MVGTGASVSRLQGLEWLSRWAAWSGVSHQDHHITDLACLELASGV